MSALRYMLPGHALLDHRDLAVGDAKALGDAPLNHSRSEQSANFKDIALGQLGHAMFAAASSARQSVRNGVQLVVPSVRPLEVVNAVIGFVTVLVVHLIAAVRRFNEGTRDKTVHELGEGLAATAKRYAGIAVALVALRADSWLRSSECWMAGRSDANPFALNRSNASQTRHFVAVLEVLNRSPNLFHARRLPCLP